MRDQDRLEDQGLPSDPHAERTLLGAMLLEPLALAEGMERMQEGAWYLDSHRRIFLAMRELYRAGTEVDYTTLRSLLASRKELDSVGGYAYILDLTEGIPRRMAIESWARIVEDCARRREGILYAERMKDSFLDGTERPQDVLQRGIEAFGEIAEDHSDLQLHSVGEFFATQGSGEEALEKMASRDGIMFGWPAFDSLTGGLQRGELMILAAMSSAGKTVAACNLVYHCAVIDGKVVVYFPLEQKKKSATGRMLSSATRIDYRRIRDLHLTPQEKAIITERRAVMASSQMFLEDASGLTMSRIKLMCSKLRNQKIAEGFKDGLDLIVIDQLSHVDDSDLAQRGVNPEVTLGKQAHAAKNIAEDLNVPVILLHQMTQEGGKRSDPKPKLTDLAGSGRIKNHADMVAFIHRPEMYDKSNLELKGKALFILAKNREGRADDVEMEYHGDIMRFDDPSQPVAKQEEFPSYDDRRWSEPDREFGF